MEKAGRTNELGVLKMARVVLLLTCPLLALGSEVPIAANNIGALARFSSASPEADGLSPSTIALQSMIVEDNTYEMIKETCTEVPFSVCVGGGKAIVPPAQPKSLVGHWTFDDMVGHDSSGLGNGMKPAPQVGPARGGIGYSAYFNGTNYGSVNHIGEFESSDMTVTFWMFLLQDSTGMFRYILQKGDSRQFTPTLTLWDKNNKLHLKVTTEDGITESLDSTAVIQMQRWTHISIVIQGKLLQMYVNGIMDSQLIASSGISFNRMPLFVGRGQAHSGTPCFIDELRIHRSALHEHAIQAFADGALGPVGPTFARLGCHNCTQEAAGQACSVFTMHGGYELCSERDMLGGALGVARAQGWLFETKMQFWANTNSKGGSKSLLTAPSKDVNERRLGLCCRKVKHYR